MPEMRPESSIVKETAICPNCQTKAFFTGHEVVARYHEEVLSEAPPIGIESRCFVGVCPSCNHPVMIERVYSNDMGMYGDIFTHPPLVKEPPEALPASIRKDLGEAYKCRTARAYMATAVMCRRLLESTCSHFGAQGRSLPKRIDDLLGRIHRNEGLKERAHLIKTIGNEGAHASATKVEGYDADSVLLFCEELVHHLFVTQARFEAIKKRRGKKGVSTTSKGKP